MSRVRSLVSTLLIGAALVPLAASAQRVAGPIESRVAEDGGIRCYQLISYGNRPNKEGTWETAQVEAEAIATPAEDNQLPTDFPEECWGLESGYLATIRSQAEQDFILDTVIGPNISILRQDTVWIGGRQVSNQNEPAGDWKWVDGGDINIGAYQNWIAGDPDDGGGGKGNGRKSGSGLEDYLALVLGEQPGWSDVGGARDSSGYIVEWGVPKADDGACLAGCPVGSNNAVFQLPGDYEAQGVAQEFQEFRFLDPRVLAGTCGTTSNITDPTIPGRELVQDGVLTLFKDNDQDTEFLEIPPAFCGFNGILVYITDGEFQFDGTAEFKQEEPLGQGFNCVVPVPAGADPQFQELILFQSKLPEDMAESGPTYQSIPGNNGIFKGAATDVSDGCSSSRGRVIRGSFIVAGLSFYVDRAYLANRLAYETFGYSIPSDFNPPSDPLSNADAVELGLGDLAVYKFLILQGVIDEAGLVNNNFVSNGAYQNVASQTRNAYEQFLNGDFQNSIDVLNNNVSVNIVPESFVDASQDYGGIQMRLASLIFHLEKLKSVQGF